MNAININGTSYDIADSELDMSLLDYLRERRFLTGTKNGCGEGLCGSCTVVLDDKAVRSCKTPLRKALGKSVLTIEALEQPGGGLHPLQKAFIECGAIQCGFCTPGMIMNAYALLLRESSPSRELIRSTMRGNLCRCTGYQQIVDAVESAGKMIRERVAPEA